MEQEFYDSIQTAQALQLLNKVNFQYHTKPQKNKDQKHMASRRAAYYLRLLVEKTQST